MVRQMATFLARGIRWNLGWVIKSKAGVAETRHGTCHAAKDRRCPI